MSLLESLIPIGTLLVVLVVLRVVIPARRRERERMLRRRWRENQTWPRGRPLK
jgi:hypothetical protein